MVVTSSPNHVWTARWKPLVPHFEQIRLWRSLSRYKVVTAGRRSGKTELAKRKVVEQLVAWTSKGRGGRILVGAPTQGQAMGIFFRDLVDLLDPDWIEAVRESDGYIETISGASISVVGLDEPARIEGIGWDAAVVDEIADCPPGTWMKHVMPAMATEDCWAWVIGVPDEEGRNFHEQRRLIELARAEEARQVEASSKFHPLPCPPPDYRERGKARVWSHHTWSAEEIIGSEMVEIFRGAMDARTYEQEIHGRTVARASAALEDFRAEVHVKRCEYQRGLPLRWSLDFNVNPMCSGVFQIVGKEMHVLCELEERHSDTSRACAQFARLVAERKWDATNVAIYGDATGRARDSTGGESDWDIVRGETARWRPTWHVWRSNPTQRATLNSVRGMLRSANGEVALRIDPSCRGLIRDMEEAVWPGDLSGFHHLAWLRYAVAEWRDPQFEWPKVGGMVGWSRV